MHGEIQRDDVTSGDIHTLAWVVKPVRRKSKATARTT